MINLEEQFSPRVNPADANYPFGSIKDNTSPGANDGTPLSAVWGNDFEGFRQAAMTEAGITPSGSQDTAQDSQLLDAVKTVVVGSLSSPESAGKIGSTSGATVQDVINNLDGRADLNDARFTELYGADGSNVIGHDQGVGGSPRKVRAVLRDRFNIADFKVSTDSDWTNAFQRAASSGESVSVYCKDAMPGLFSPVIVDAPTTFYCDGRFKQSIAKAHNGPMFNVISSGVNLSDMTLFNDETVGAGGSLILLNTTSNSIEDIKIKNMRQQGGSCIFLLDGGSASTGLIVDLLLDDVKIQGSMANAITLTKAFAYLDMKKVTVNYVPSASKAFTGISITGNEGCNLEWCHVNHGITAATANSYGFVFSNSKAIWVDRCQADTCGVDGFRFENCQYVYGNQLSASLCGGDGITMSGSDITIGNSYFGGRRGLAYPGASGSALVRSTASKAFLNGCNLSNGGFNGFASSASTVLSGGGIFNTVTPYTISGSAKLRQVMNDAGTLVDAG